MSLPHDAARSGGHISVDSNPFGHFDPATTSWEQWADDARADASSLPPGSWPTRRIKAAIWAKLPPGLRDEVEDWNTAGVPVEFHDAPLPDIGAAPWLPNGRVQQLSADGNTVVVTAQREMTLREYLDAIGARLRTPVSMKIAKKRLARDLVMENDMSARDYMRHVLRKCKAAGEDPNDWLDEMRLGVSKEKTGLGDEATPHAYTQSVWEQLNLGEKAGQETTYQEVVDNIKAAMDRNAMLVASYMDAPYRKSAREQRTAKRMISAVSGLGGTLQEWEAGTPEERELLIQQQLTINAMGSQPGPIAPTVPAQLAAALAEQEKRLQSFFKEALQLHDQKTTEPLRKELAQVKGMLADRGNRGDQNGRGERGTQRQGGRGCWTCGSMDHQQRHCPQRMKHLAPQQQAALGLMLAGITTPGLDLMEQFAPPGGTRAEGLQELEAYMRGEMPEDGEN